LEAVVHPQKGVGTGYRFTNYGKASRNGEPFEEVIKKYGVPNRANPHCTRELKLRPIHKFMKDVVNGKYLTAIGIRADESHRINRKEAEKNGYIYPLTDELKAYKAFINNWWEQQPFTLEIEEHEGNCDWCFKKSLRKKLKIAKETPDVPKQWIFWEKEYGEGYTFHTGKTSEQLVEESKDYEDKPVKNFDPQMDIEYDCVCKST
jgi:hypothetical protein